MTLPLTLAVMIQPRLYRKWITGHHALGTAYICRRVFISFIFCSWMEWIAADHHKCRAGDSELQLELHIQKWTPPLVSACRHRVLETGLPQRQMPRRPWDSRASIALESLVRAWPWTYIAGIAPTLGPHVRIPSNTRRCRTHRAQTCPLGSCANTMPALWVSSFEHATNRQKYR